MLAMAWHMVMPVLALKAMVCRESWRTDGVEGDGRRPAAAVNLKVRFAILHLVRPKAKHAKPTGREMTWRHFLTFAHTFRRLFGPLVIELWCQVPVGHCVRQAELAKKN